MNDSSASPDDLKRQRILERAAKVFLAYGIQRTTMDDIAKAAEMSRPALYLLFRNKIDIYQAIALSYFDASVAGARQVLAGDGPIDERLNLLLERSIFAMMEEFMRSPHGPEILDMKNQLAAEVLAGWKSTMASLVAEALDRAARDSGVDLAARGYSAETLASLFWDAIEGMKARLQNLDELRVAARSLVSMTARAVTPT
ncbi:TetR/AcrR family transcriptional regulator [Mesorhizobium sp. J428]|uniref:TetR/AcrR family transcriptional regulator n=1 Tax=Mesorhizobium sp. J428 TaxID=2898440 RepID=UPI00215158FC|nr:TetR/AcrR family transcriptional regulator [Mesorhizobium sp. J428]MCR5857055.1 TetR/AcrR family transcriptional regulator [Mesorhizobium sp. J428]